VGEAGVVAVLLCVPLLDHAKAAELSLVPVEVAIVVGVARDEAAPPYVIEDLDSFHDMHREGKACCPGLASEVVSECEPSRGCIVDLRRRAEVVGHPCEEVGLLTAHDVDVAHLPASLAGQRARPDETCRAISEKVHDLDRAIAADPRKGLDKGGRRPAIPGLVGIHARACLSKVEYVRRTGAVHVSQSEAMRVELI
jgi:hypothetical protein